MNDPSHSRRVPTMAQRLAQSAWSMLVSHGTPRNTSTLIGYVALWSRAFFLRLQRPASNEVETVVALVLLTGSAWSEL